MGAKRESRAWNEMKERMKERGPHMYLHSTNVSMYGLEVGTLLAVLVFLGSGGRDGG